MAKKTKQEAQQERLSLAEKRNRQDVKKEGVPDGKKDKAGGSAGASVPGGKKKPSGKKKQKKQKRKRTGKARRNKKSRKEREQEKRKKKQDRDRRKQKGIPTTAHQSIPYIRMLQDVICQVTKNFFSKTIQFYDINYQLALNEDKTTIFENYCDFLNYFDSSISVQLSFINQQVDVAEFEKSIDIPDQNDDFNAIRDEYRTMLKNQLSKGNNGLVKTKYITFGIEAESLKVARPRLERIETDILNNFKVLGAQAHSLNGLERLEILYHVFNQDRIEPFKFQYKMLPETGLKTKDFIAPTSFNFSKNQTFMMGRTMGSVSYLQILAPELTDRMLADFLDVDDSINVNIHIQSIDQSSAIKMIKSKISDLDKMKIEEQKRAVRSGYDMDVLPSDLVTYGEEAKNSAIKMIKSKISDLDKMKIEEQKRAVRSGYDMDVLPSDLVTYGEEAKNLLEDLQSRNERMFLVTVLVMNTAKKRQKLDNNIFQVQGIAQKYNCSLKQLDYQQEAALMSCIPLGVNRIEIQRGLTTSPTAIFVPFTTQELFQEGEALYYGLNALSNNMIMVDRKRLKNPNGLILGTPGSGKSFSAKREITNCFLITEDDIIICDPEAEYSPLVQALHGQVVRVSPVSDQYINPMDLNLNYSEEDNPLSLKADFILSLCELIVGGKNGLEPVEKTIIDRCVRLVYQEYLADPVPEKMPILEDLYNLLRKQEEPEAQRLATSLEIYVTGSLNVFNHQTNVDINNRIVCFDIKELGKQLKKIGMLVIQDQVWNRVTMNRSAHKSTRYYVDEFHLLLKEEQTAAYSVEIWKRFRKWGGIPTGITQNIKDLLSSREIEHIFENSDFIYMLNPASGDRQIESRRSRKHSVWQLHWKFMLQVL